MLPLSSYIYFDVQSLVRKFKRKKGENCVLCGCGTWCLDLGKSMGVVKKKMLRPVFVRKKKIVTRMWRRLCADKLHIL
jgi:hypothetical protein